MDVRGFVDTLRRRWQLVASLLLIGMLAGIGLSLMSTPKFESTTRLFLATPGWNAAAPAEQDEQSPYRGDDFSRQRALSYVRLATEPDLAQRVIAKLGEHMSAAELAAATSAHEVPDTVLIDISVKDPSAARAKRLADAMAVELCTEIKGLETPGGSLIPTVEPVVSQTATASDRPVEPAVWTNLVLGATLGLLLGASAAVASELSSRVVRGAEMVSEISRRPVLGFVPLLDRSVPGATEPSDLARLGRGADNVRAVRACLELGYPQTPHKVMVVTGVGSGDGATAVASALALVIAETGRRTILVDADLRSRAHRVGAEDADGYQTGLTAVVAGRVGLADAVEVNDATGLSVLKCGAAPDNPSSLLNSWRMRTTLEQLRSSYDTVIIEAPPVPTHDDCRILAASADGVIVVVAETVTRHSDFSAAMRALDLIEVPVLGTVVNYAAPRAPARLPDELMPERSS